MFLAIDSSQNSGSIALAVDGNIIYSSYFDLSITHSESLMPAIDHAFKVCGRAKQDMRAIVLAIGPGSFTGLRIGLASAKGISLALEIPIICFDTLLLGAVHLYGANRQIVSVIDAKMSEFYAALYDGQLVEHISPCICLPETIGDWALDNPLVIGSGAYKISELLSGKGIDHTLALPGQSISNAVGLIDLLRLYPQRLEYNFDEVAALEPLYLRDSTAQIKLAKSINSLRK